MALTDLPELFSLFFDGFQLGALLAGIPYILGLAIFFFIKLINKP